MKSSSHKIANASTNRSRGSSHFIADTKSCLWLSKKIAKINRFVCGVIQRKERRADDLSPCQREKLRGPIIICSPPVRGTVRRAPHQSSNLIPLCTLQNSSYGPNLG